MADLPLALAGAGCIVVHAAMSAGEGAFSGHPKWGRCRWQTPDLFGAWGGNWGASGIGNHAHFAL